MGQRKRIRLVLLIDHADMTTIAAGELGRTDRNLHHNYIDHNHTGHDYAAVNL